MAVAVSGSTDVSWAVRVPAEVLLNVNVSPPLRCSVPVYVSVIVVTVGVVVGVVGESSPQAAVVTASRAISAIRDNGRRIASPGQSGPAGQTGPRRRAS